MVIFFLSSNLDAQNSKLQFEHFIDDKGLTQNSIIDLLQDNEGYLWIGTANGLYKYDGQRFVLYRNELNNNKSLINNIINKLVVDSKGDLWIGTGRGLCKFDIKKQAFFRPHLSLINKEITAIYPDVDGSVWVGTSNSGLYNIKSNNKSHELVEHYFYEPNELNVINDNKILSITKDLNGSLWVGTAKGLNVIYLSKTSTKKVFNIDGVNNAVNALLIDKKGNLWAGEKGKGVLFLDQPKDINSIKYESFKSFSLGIKKPYDNFGFVNAIKEDNKGKIWIGVYGYGLVKLNPETEAYSLFTPNDQDSKSLSSRRIMTILFDNTNVLWVGTKVGGLNKCDLEKKEIGFLNHSSINQNSLTNSSINAVLEDDNNLLWVGTENGLNQIKFKDENYKSPIIKKYFFDGNKEVTQSLVEQPIRSILKDSRGDYWIGGKEIIHMQFNPKTETATFSETGLKLPDVFSMVEDKYGDIWFGSFSQGLIKWEKKKIAKTNSFDFSSITYYRSDINNENSISDNLISCLYKDSNQDLWVGTLQGGINLVIPSENDEPEKFVSFQNNPKDPNSLSHNSVFSIIEGEKDNYWVGTFGGGLNKMTFTSRAPNENKVKFKNYTEKDGLSNNAIYGILKDDKGSLWMSTDKGISFLEIDAERFKNYNKEDGLQSNNFRKNAYYKNAEGYLFFGGLKGLNIFHPKNINENTFPSLAKITGIKVKNEDVAVGEKYNGRVLFENSLSSLKKQVELKHDENNITIEFAALHFAAPEKNQFKYKLEGFDTEWVNSKGLPFAHYTNLSPGKYNFKVIASNNDGYWNENPSVIKFKIEPPFWLTGWAFLFYIFVLLVILVSIQSHFNLRSKQRAALKVQKEIEQVNRFKLQFFTNISHEFKTPITLILNPIEEILESIGENLELKPKLKIVERNANTLLRLVNQLMDFRKIEVGETKLGATKADIVSFIREITFAFRASAKKNNVKIAFESELYTKDVWFDWDKLEKILNNLIYNAIKFTPSGGQINIKISKSKNKDVLNIIDRGVNVDYIKIEIEDTGMGIDKDQLPYVFQRFYQVNQSKETMDIGSGIGLAITKDLIDLHHGVIEVNSKKGVGTSFLIKLPLGKLHLLPDEIIETKLPESLSEEEMDLNFVQEHSNLEDDAQGNQLKNTILVVDDNLDIRELVKNGLLKQYNIIQAENGKEALSIALKEIPDLVISDVLMPEMDGVEFCKELKTNIRTSHIPIILLTALNSVEHRIKGLESGADAYIPKPFKMKLLSVRVEKLIESRNLMRKYFQTEKELLPERIALNSIDQEFLKKIMNFMEANMGNESYWVDQLAADMNTSRSTFFRKLKKLIGQSPNDFMRIIRLKRAVQLLEQNELTISQVSYKVGFSDPGYFGKCFRKVYGDSPSNFIKKKQKA